MDVTKTSYQLHHHQSEFKRSESTANLLYGKNLQKTDVTPTVNGVQVEISADARKHYAISSEGLKAIDAPPALKIDDDFIKGMREHRDNHPILNQSVEIDPLENEFQIYGVTCEFFAGSPDEKISNLLNGKMINPSLFTSQLLEKVRGGSSENTAQERALERESALKLAEHIAETCFDNDEDASAFLEAVNKASENSILREKGYVVFDNSDMTPFKKYTMPGAPNDYVRVGPFEYAQKYYGVKNTEEFLNDPRLSAINKAFMYDIQYNPHKIEDLRKEILQNDADLEKTVDDASSMAKNTFSQVTTGKDFASGITDVLNELNKQSSSKWINNMLKLVIK